MQSPDILAIKLFGLEATANGYVAIGALLLIVFALMWRRKRP